ncbi:zona pellucida sperm-binding protein 1-like [Spea bombifrons]|uniref:zona pellucida sperm-binding protein 1-like n=1 Tax=Spea bombifrons TaxID=233779 RepID=UPI002349BC10|nr:zona pellucida sperm-binding protein 1-like [Spea bombifrons]
MILAGRLWLLLSLWPLLTVCASPSGPQYTCGEDGVQLRVPPNYMGQEVSFQVRDEFGMGYDLSGCLSRCLFSSRGPDGESVFYSPYSVCLSVFKDGVWKLRVRLVGSQKSEDLDLVCPKPRIPRPRVIARTRRPHSIKNASEHMFPSKAPSTKPMSLTKTLPLHHTLSPEKTLLTGVAPTDKISHWNLTTKSLVPHPAIYDTEGEQIASQCLITSGRLSCLNTNVSRDECVNSRCCYDHRDALTPCYHGHTVFLRCYAGGDFQLVISRHVTEPPLLLDTVDLGSPQCQSPTLRNDDFLEFKGRLDQCGIHKFMDGHLVYELTLSAMQDILFSPTGSITRDTAVKVLSRCTYPSSHSVSLVSLVVSPVPIASLTKKSGLSLELRIARDASFTSFFSSTDFPLRFSLGNFVFLEVRLLYPSDPRLHLRLHHCWGAPTLNSASESSQWPLIYNGCPYDGDDIATQILAVPMPSSYQRFAVSAFTFLGDPNKTQVYFFCSVSVCLPSISETCISNCTTLSGRSRRSPKDSPIQLVNSFGPLVVEAERRSPGLGDSHPLISIILWVICASLLILGFYIICSLKS